MLTFIEDAGRSKWGKMAKFRCDCGKETIIIKKHFLSGNTKSCGCLKLKVLVARSTVHGKTHTLTHSSWLNMRHRCTRPSNEAYHHYGGRGIKVCERWLNSFPNFLEDMGECPAGYTIERIDNNGNYEPGNCKWATRKEQNHNRRNSISVTVNGQRKNLKDWARESNTPYHTLYSRVKEGRFDEFCNAKRGEV